MTRIPQTWTRAAGMLGGRPKKDLAARMATERAVPAGTQSTLHFAGGAAPSLKFVACTGITINIGGR